MDFVPKCNRDEIYCPEDGLDQLSYPFVFDLDSAMGVFMRKEGVAWHNHNAHRYDGCIDIYAGIDLA